MRLISLFALALAACVPTPTPAPVPPDADAAPAPPAPPSDAAPTTPCAAACASLSALGCSEGKSAECTTVMAHVDGSRLIREPSGKPLTCADVASAHTVDAVRALGVACGVSP